METQFVEVTRKIAVGAGYRIHPSYGWAGVEEGCITVEKICNMNDDPEVKEAAELQIECFVGPEEADPYIEELKKCLWVKARYTTKVVDSPELLVLDLNTFSELISTK
jgi:hypothetical protein